MQRDGASQMRDPGAVRKPGSRTAAHHFVLRCARDTKLWRLHFMQQSNPEISRGDFLAGQRLRLAVQRDAAFLQAIDMARGLQRLHDVLLDDDERNAFADDRRDRA